MSDRSLPHAPPSQPVTHRTALSSHTAPPPAAGSRTATTQRAGLALLDSLAPLLSEWLPRQRWFAGKDRPISGFTLVAATELLPCGADGTTPGLIHLLVRARQPVTPGQPPGPADCYQLLLGVRKVLPPEFSRAVIGRPSVGPLRDRTVYEALHDPRLAGLLLERMRAPGRLGSLRFGAEAGAAIASGLRPRLLGTEQSNSSVIYGSAYILKLFRRVSPGLNPDLELPLVLTRGGCERVPAAMAWFETAPTPQTPPLTLGVLQPYLPGTRDGWQLALRALDDREDFTGAARSLGRATAEVHAGLADALPTTVLHRAQLEQLATGMTERLHAATGAVPALHPYRSGLRNAFSALSGLARRGQTCRAQRIHGDLHLGQALRAGPDGQWYLIDFEGEPARPLAERRRLEPVVRDVAGMLRSFDYAACQQDSAGDRAQEWAADNRDAYCSGYAEVAGADPRADAALLRAFETDKAIYEVLYEAHHRPAWLPIPMAAIRRLAAAPS